MNLDALWWLGPPSIVVVIGALVLRSDETATEELRRDTLLRCPRTTSAALRHGEVALLRGRVVASETTEAALSGRAGVWELHTVSHVPSATGRSTRKVAYTKTRSHPFRLDDGSGATVLVDPRAATVYVDAEQIAECGAFADPLPARARALLERRKIAEVSRMWFHESLIAPDDEILVLGTAVVEGDERTMRPLPSPDGVLVISKLDVEALAHRLHAGRRLGWILLAIGVGLVVLALTKIATE